MAASDQLTVADLKNRKTDEATHNSRSRVAAARRPSNVAKFGFSFCRAITGRSRHTRTAGDHIGVERDRPIPCQCSAVKLRAGHQRNGGEGQYVSFED